MALIALVLFFSHLLILAVSEVYLSLCLKSLVEYKIYFPPKGFFAYGKKIDWVNHHLDDMSSVAKTYATKAILFYRLQLFAGLLGFIFFVAALIEHRQF